MIFGSKGKTSRSRSGKWACVHGCRVVVKFGDNCLNFSCKRTCKRTNYTAITRVFIKKSLCAGAKYSYIAVLIISHSILANEKHFRLVIDGSGFCF